MSTYLKNMTGYKYNQLKSKSHDEIQEMFDKEMKRVNTFVDMNTELVKGSKTKAEGSSKRAGNELKQEKAKKQKADDDQEEAEMKRHIEIVKDDEAAIDAIPLATKPLVIVDYKIDKDGRMGYFKLIRANRSSKRYSSMIKMLQGIDREDLETLWKLVKAKYKNTRPEEDYKRVLCRDLKVMFEPDIKSDVWRNLQGYKVTIWKLFDNCGVHFGISITRDSTGMFLSQKKYALELLDMAHMDNCNPTRTLLDTQSKLGYDEDPISDPTLYCSLAGGLQYLTFTHPDISYAVQHVCLHMHDPREPHLAALKRVIQSVHDTLDFGLQLYVSIIDNLLLWLAKRQDSLSRSSAEAEYRGVANVIAETGWLRNLLRELHTPLLSTTLCLL
ncbi:ribonuclease H-like domain-containing protein [Tanacetum coccineum]|uniref:Ribonuclease H-like domain-containing protein n=1 Tax=Tanacetum coccineum TaxID=301880 RepID=A0ABQ5BJY2_9ASTR